MADSKKVKQQLLKRNIVESLKDLGSATSQDFFESLMGMELPKEKRSGEIKPGESFEWDEENKKLKAQITLERNLSQEERSISDRKIAELRVQLQAITVEISKLAASTGNLATQAEIAMIEVPASPGVYHLVFFEKVLEFLRSFRKKIDEASVWLNTSNKRAEKKNYWSMYKKKGSSFLLSPDHYLQRSAG